MHSRVWHQSSAQQTVSTTIVVINPLVTSGMGKNPNPRRTGKVCTRGGTREPQFEEGGGGGDPTPAANPAVPGRKRRSQSHSGPALLGPAPRARSGCASPPGVPIPKPPPGADMASGATPTAVKVRLAVLAATARPCPLRSRSRPGGPRVGGVRPAWVPCQCAAAEAGKV